mmetsp:Transcript_139215/g.259637  ORF Transcript_139215/g.259637 Transcript_139215/m.259637 type:complete len:381 (-) Transcript_139215:106-1248(-)
MFGKGGKGGFGKFQEEDRSRDWYCPKCSERNFLKRAECFKCKSPKPKDGGAGPPQVPATGTTLDGMIKSYNRKGFGFIMCIGGSAQCQDIYYSRESLHPMLQTRDIPGEHVTFEIQRFPDGKLVAKNVRPRGDASGFKSDDPRPVPKFPAFGIGGKGMKLGGREEEDRSRDWTCEKCSERNFVKRFECFKCKAPRPSAEPEPAGPGPRRTFSPHAGSRAVREALAGKRCCQSSGSDESSRSRSRGRGKKKKKKHSSASSSSSSREKKKRKKKRKRRDSSSDESSSSSRKSSKSEGADEARSSATSGAADAQPKNPEVEKAKAEALERLMKLQSVEPKEARMKQWRELLRQWHPDKNADRAEVATAVFQFLQKAKPMVDRN